MPQLAGKGARVQSAMLDLLERASASAPGDAAALRRYANACVHVGDASRAVPALQRLIAVDPDDGDAWAALGRMQTLSNRMPEAAAASAQAVRLRPDNSSYLSDYGFALRLVGKDEQADALFARAVELEPENTHAQRGLGQALVRIADGNALLRHCEQAIDRLGPRSWLIAQYLVALSLLGRRRAVATLLDYDRLVSEREIDCPATFDSIPAFNSALRNEAHEAGTTTSGGEPNDIVYQGRRLRGGLKATIEALGTDRAPASAALLEEFVRQARDYADGLEDCVLRRARPASSEVSTDVIVTCEGSAVLPHTHPSSWIAGVYYAAIPEGTGDQGPGGCMEFGPPLHKVALPQGIWPTRLLRPRPGLMALFPGYVYHRVHANDIEGERIAITFDSLPTAGSRAKGVSHDLWLGGLPQE